MEQGDLGLGERGEVVERAAFPVLGGLFGQGVLRQQLFPGAGIAFALAFAAGPAADVHDRIVAVDAGDAVGMAHRPVVRIQAAARHADHRRLLVQAGGCENVIELIPDVHGRRRAVEPEGGDIDHVEAILQQRQIGLRFVAEEFGAPGPGMADIGEFGLDHLGRAAGNCKVIAFITEPARTLGIGRELGGDVKSGIGGDGQMAVGELGEHVGAFGIGMDGIGEEGIALQHRPVEIEDIGTGVIGDLAQGWIDFVGDDRLADAPLVGLEYRDRQADDDARFRGQALEDLDHLGGIGGKARLVPVLRFGIVGSQLDQHEIGGEFLGLGE